MRSSVYQTTGYLRTSLENVGLSSWVSASGPLRIRKSKTSDLRGAQDPPPLERAPSWGRMRPHKPGNGCGDFRINRFWELE
jgi:hypothetical protein